MATELGKALGKRGHKVHFLSYNQPVRLDVFHENLYYHEVTFLKYPLFEFPPYETALTSKIVNIARFEQLDLVHAHYAIPHASAAIMAKQILSEMNYRLPVITTLHGTDITLIGKDVSYEPVVSYSINKSDAVTAVSQSLLDDTLKLFHIQNKISVIPNFIDLNRFKVKPLDHFKKAIAPHGEYILIHSSNFRKVKRVDDVLKVFAKVRETVPSKLILIGDGPERQSLEQLSRDLDISSCVIFLGKQEAVEELLAIADVFLLPSESESFGLAALEAMACGVPIISSDAGGLPEVNIHGVSGFISPLGDVDDMAKNVISLLTNSDLLATMRQTALKTASKFELENVIPLYENLYNSVLNP